MKKYALTIILSLIPYKGTPDPGGTLFLIEQSNSMIEMLEYRLDQEINALNKFVDRSPNPKYTRYMINNTQDKLLLYHNLDQIDINLSWSLQRLDSLSEDLNLENLKLKELKG